MPLVEFCGQSAYDPDNGQANTSRLINCYREAVGGRSTYVLKSVLGTAGFASLDGVFLRAMKEVRGFLYVVHAGNLLRLSQGGVVLTLGAVDDDTTTFLSSHDGQVTIAANGRYYLWDGSAMSNPTINAFTSIQDVLFMNQRTVLIERDGRRLTWSEVGDPTDFPGDNVATAEQEDDNCLRAFQIGGSLWVFKERSIERFRNTATGFAYIPGSKIERGLRSAALAVEIPDGVFFIGNDGLPYIAGGPGISKPLSANNRAIETALKLGTPTHCLYHEDEGAKHLVVRFFDRPALVCDMATGEWHERASGQEGAWSAIVAEEAFGSSFVGTSEGNIYRLKRVNSDVEGPLIRTAVSNTFYNGSKRFRVPLVEFRGRVGHSFLGRSTATVLSTAGLVLADGSGAALQLGTLTEAPRDAQIMLEVSKDYGETWGNPKQRSMGDLGDYGQRVTYRSLGQFRSLTLRASISDPAALTLDASAVVEVA
jgi:hypothetical protein